MFSVAKICYGYFSSARTVLNQSIRTVSHDAFAAKAQQQFKNVTDLDPRQILSFRNMSGGTLSLHDWQLTHYGDLGIFKNFKLIPIDENQKIHQLLGSDFDYDDLYDTTKKELIDGGLWKTHVFEVDASIAVTKSVGNHEEDSCYSLQRSLVNLAIYGNNKFNGFVVGEPMLYVVHYNFQNFLQNSYINF